jgi:hypothetical protein
MNLMYHINLYRYYSLYGHVDTMAREIHKGAASIEGVEATLWRVIFQSLVRICNVLLSSRVRASLVIRS